MKPAQWMFSLGAAAGLLGAPAVAAGNSASPQNTRENPAPSVPGQAPSLPDGVSAALYAISVPAGSEPRPEVVALGDKLFNDKRISSDGTVACATCHVPETGFVDHKVTSEGVGKQRGQRNSPTVLNAMFNATQFWDGRSATLEDQAKLPILNPIEMGMKSPEDVVAKVKAIPEYAASFQKLYGRAVTYDDLAASIASFERTQYSGSSAFDKFIGGDEKAVDDSAKRGWALFNGKARCTDCHAGNRVNPLFSDQKFHNIGVAAHKQNFTSLAREARSTVEAGDQKQIDELAVGSKFSELGRFLVTKKTNDIGAFKTPTLRNIAITAPYMHDGTFATLWDVLDHYNKGGIANPFLDGGMQRLGLTEKDEDDLVGFLASLTDVRYAGYAKKELARQRTLKVGKRPERDLAIATGKKTDVGDLAPNPDPSKNPASIGVY